MFKGLSAFGAGSASEPQLLILHPPVSIRAPELEGA